MAPPSRCKWKWQNTILLFLRLSASVQAKWYLDESCYDQSTMIQKAMTSAFDMIHAGQNALGRVPQPLDPTWSEQDKLTYQAEQDLVKYVFGTLVNDDKVDPNNKDYKDAMFTLGKISNFNNFAGLARSANLETVAKQIAQQTGKPYKAPPSPKKGVTIVPASEYLAEDTLFVYCNYDRMGPIGQDCYGKKYTPPKGVKTPGRCNMALNRLSEWTSAAKSCGGSGLGPTSINMLTSVRGGPKWDPNDHSKLQEPKNKSPISGDIMICPSYLKSWSKKKIQTFAEQGDKAPAARNAATLLKDVGKNVYNYLDDKETAMDLYDTGDVTLVHEMTHAIFEYPLDDVEVGGSAAYTWKKIRKLSDQKSQDNTLKSTNNADSFGRFCLGAKMISPTAPKIAQRVNADGSIEVLFPKGSSQPSAKKSAPPTTLSKVKRQAGNDGDAATSHGKGKSGTSTSHGHSNSVRYKTIETVFTTVVTEELTIPIGGQRTSTHGAGSGPGGQSSRHGQDTSSHRPDGKSTSHHAGGKPTSHHGQDTSSHHPGGKPTGRHSHSASSQHPGGKPTSHHGQGTSSHHGGGQPTSRHGPTTQAPTATSVQKTTIPVTSGQSTTSVVYVGDKLPKPVNGDPLGWKCTGPLCDLSCSFPIICTSTGEGIWGLLKGWIPKIPGGGSPQPGGPSPPPKPDGDPQKSQPGIPSKSQPSKSDHEPSKSTQHTSSHTTSCKPRTTSVCPVVATHSKGPDGKETTKRVTKPCKTTTLHDCTAKAHGSTSTTSVSAAAQSILSAIEYADNFDDGISDWNDMRDTALAALVADTTNPYVYASASATPTSHKSEKSSGKPTSSLGHKPTSKPTSHQTSKHVPKPSSHQTSRNVPKPSSKHTSDHAPKPSTKPSTKASAKPTSTQPTGPKPSTTKYSKRCKNWSIKDNHSVQGTCTDKNGKEVTSSEDLGLCLYYNKAHMTPQNNGNIDKVCKYCFFNAPTAPDASSVWCVCQDSGDKSAYSVSSNLDDFLNVQDDGFVSCFGHISAPS